MKDFDILEISSYLTLFQFVIWAGSGIFGIIAARFLWQLKSRKQSYKRVYFPTDKVDFYIRFARDVRCARKTIRNSGDGFMLSNPDSLKLANTLDAAFCEAMENGVDVFRFQITGSAPISWYSRLYALKKKYPDQFHVYMNQAYDSMGSFCVIDQGLRKTVYEHQILTGSTTGRGTESSTTTFVYGHQSQSDRAAELFDRAVKDKDTIELRIEDIERVQRQEWKKTLDRALADPRFKISDPEIIDHIRSRKKSKAFPKAAFPNDESQALNFLPNWNP